MRITVDQLVIDSKDIDLVKQYLWYEHPKGYIWGRKKGTSEKLVYLHRLIVNATQDKHLQVDHINRNKKDNRRCNLRLCTHAENCQNRPGGIYWNKHKRKWRVGFMKNGKYNYIGDYKRRLQAELKLKEHKGII